MRSRATGIISGAAWSLVCAFGVAACWDAASLNVSTSDLSVLDASTDSSTGTPSSCPSPLVSCAAACVDTSSDPTNCGGCGIACGFPPPPVCEGSLAVAFAPGPCAAGKCAFQRLTMDCGALNRQCTPMGCTACIPGHQDNDMNGSCTPDCAMLGFTCSGHGICNDITGTATCACDPGFSGVACATNIDDCAGAPCLNGGTCVDGVASYTCNCVGGFSGLNCQTSPVTLPGLTAHFDARNLASLVLGAGNTVTAWADVSGNGRTLSPSGNAPIYSATLIGGRPGVDFGNARMITAAFPLTTDVTVFALIQYRTQAQWGAIAHHGNRDNDWSLEQSGFDVPNPIMHWQSVNDNTGAELTFVVGTDYIATGRITGTLREFSSTSKAAGTVSTSAVGNSIVAGSKVLYVGASDVPEFSNAYIGELIYYSRSLTDAERDNVILYLKTVWGI